MKNVLIVVGLVFLLCSCDETKPNIFPDTGAEELAGVDTTYILPASEIPEADYRGVLIEDLTGVKCVACPNASAEAAAIMEDETLNEIVVLGLYPIDPPVLTFPYPNYPDLRTDIAQDIATSVYDYANQVPGGVAL